MAGTSSSVYLDSLCRNGHLRHMINTPPSSVSSSSPSVSDSESDPEPEADAPVDEFERCNDMRPIVFQETMQRFPFLKSSQLAQIEESLDWNIEIRLRARKPLVQTAPGMFKVTPVIRLSLGLIPFSSYELMRFTHKGCYKDALRFESIPELLNALEPYLRHLEPAE